MGMEEMMGDAVESVRVKTWRMLELEAVVESNAHGSLTDLDALCQYAELIPCRGQNVHRDQDSRLQSGGTSSRSWLLFQQCRQETAAGGCWCWRSGPQ
jgi:hypothetical protein